MEHVVLTPEQELKGYSEILLSSIIDEKEEAIKNKQFLFSNAMTDIFRDEAYVLYKLFYSFKDKPTMKIDERFVQLYLQNHLGDLEQYASKRKIDINAYGVVDDSNTLAYIGGVIKYFNRLSELGTLPYEEYIATFEKYAMVFKTVETQKVLSNSMLILSDGLKIGRKTLQGFEASRDYVKNNLARIEGLIDQNNGVGFVNMSDVILNPNIEVESTIVSDFDEIDELNEHYGGIYTGNLYTIMAPSKSGKSKFCARLAHTAMVKYGTNVSVWAFEGGYLGWTDQMRAIHFDYFFNRDRSATEQIHGVTQGSIRHKKIDEDVNLSRMENSSKLDLATNENYGSTHYIDRPFKVETFLDEIDTSVKENNSKLLVIDYLQLIDSEKSMSERERIASAYPKLLEYCKKNNIAVVSPAQYKQAVVDELQNMKDDATRDMRTAGGASYEIVKTSDVIISLWATTEDLDNHKMSILPMPTRFYDAIPKFDIYVDLGSCRFASFVE